MIPDYFEPLKAYRAFGVFPNGLLVGQAHTEPWPPYQPFVARCGDAGYGAKAHISPEGLYVTPPVLPCTCGIYALKSESEARLRAFEANMSLRIGFSNGSPTPSYNAWGSVSIWGRAIEHERGYRAEFAYPSELWVDDERIARRVQRLYGIPCHRWDGHLGDQDIDTFADSLSMIVRRMSKLMQPIYYSPHYSPNSPRMAVVPAGLVSVLSHDISQNPIIIRRAAPTPVAPHLVGATPWQIRQYGKMINPGNIIIPDWRDILRQMIHAR